MPRLADASPPAASLRGLDADKWQRGHVGPPVAIAWWPPNITTLLRSMLCRLCQWAQRRTAMPRHHHAVAWSARQLWCSPAAAKLHNAALPSVSASQSQAPFVSGTASRPSGEGNRLYAKLPSLGTVAQPLALPGRIRALRAASWLPCGFRGTVASVRRFAQGVWSVACGQLSCVCPAHPVASPLRGIGLALGARPPPRGSLSPAPRAPAGLRPALSLGELRLPDQA